MCRILTVVVFLLSICSVISTTCMNSPTIKDKRQSLMEYFRSTVSISLMDPKITEKKVEEFEKELNSYFKTANEICNLDMQVNSSNFIDLVRFSLQNKSYQETFINRDCIRKYERNITQCVKNHAGFIKISSEKKHTTWFAKVLVRYDAMTCDLAASVKNCVLVRLNDCRATVVNYVASLFDFTLKNCPVIKTANKTSPNKASMLSEPIGITISMGVIFAMQVTRMLRDIATP